MIRRGKRSFEVSACLTPDLVRLMPPGVSDSETIRRALRDYLRKHNARARGKGGRARFRVE